MMIPNASELVRRRWTARTIARCSALFLAALAFIPIISWFTEGITDDDFFDLWYYADRIAIAVFCFGAGLVAWFLQGLIVRILVPIPKGTRCPRCNHKIEGMTEQICTECGLELTPEFIATPAPGGAIGAATQDTRVTPFVVANRRAIVTSIFRVIGVLWLAWALMALVGSIAALLMINDYDFYAYTITSLIQSIAMTLIGVLLTFRAGSIARLCVAIPPDQDLTPSPPAPDENPS